MNKKCLICSSPLIQEDATYEVSGTSDFICRDNKDHSFVMRVVDEHLYAFKFKFIEGEQKFYLKINYPLNNTLVWSTHNDKKSKIDKISIPQALVIDASDLSKIKQKIKTILLFS